jgi:hypothetical protein
MTKTNQRINAAATFYPLNTMPYQLTAGTAAIDHATNFIPLHETLGHAIPDRHFVCLDVGDPRQHVTYMVARPEEPASG